MFGNRETRITPHQAAGRGNEQNRTQTSRSNTEAPSSEEASTSMENNQAPSSDFEADIQQVVQHLREVNESDVDEVEIKQIVEALLAIFRIIIDDQEDLNNTSRAMFVLLRKHADIEL